MRGGRKWSWVIIAGNENGTLFLSLANERDKVPKKRGESAEANITDIRKIMTDEIRGFVSAAEL